MLGHWPRSYTRFRPYHVAYNCLIDHAFVVAPGSQLVSAVICYTLLTASPKAVQMTPI